MLKIQEGEEVEYQGARKRHWLSLKENQIGPLLQKPIQCQNHGTLLLSPGLMSLLSLMIDLEKETTPKRRIHPITMRIIIIIPPKSFPVVQSNQAPLKLKEAQ
jgi:hypothetical protein